MWENLLIPAVVVIAGTVIYLAWRAEQKRTQAMAEFAKLHNFHFDPTSNADHDDHYAQFEIFRRGHSRRAKNTMTGDVELFGHSCALRCGDFRYKRTSGSGKNRRTTTYRFSYLIVHPPWDTPPLLIRPEGIFDKVAGAFGFDDIDFESVEFSKRFYVKSTDKRFAYDVLHARMMEFLLAERPPMIDIEGGALCLSGGKKRWEPQEFANKIDFLSRFCENWPRHLVKDLDS